MDHLECSRDENIVRAIRDSDYDKKNDRLSSLLFKGSNKSVSRLIILSLDELFKIFHCNLDKPFISKVVAAGEINVGKLQDIGANFDNPTTITVIIKPLSENPAHAEIPQKISRGLSKKIRDNLKIHNDPTSA